jgi:hypothetical protein
MSLRSAITRLSSSTGRLVSPSRANVASATLLASRPTIPASCSWSASSNLVSKRGLTPLTGGTLQSRFLHHQTPLQARYERFDPPGGPFSGRSGGGPDPRPPRGGGNGSAPSNLLAFIRRRVGGDRAIWVYGIGLGGSGLYYVTQ